MNSAMQIKLTMPNSHLSAVIKEKLLKTVSKETSTSTASTLRTIVSRLFRSSASAKK